MLDLDAEVRTTVIHNGEGRVLEGGGSGTHFKLWSESTGAVLSIVEHPIDPGVLVPPHVHSREDQTSYVVEGAVNILVGEDIFHCSPGSYVFKPRNIPHTFWNESSTPARLIEISTPGGVERYMEGLFEMIASGTATPETVGELAGRFGMTLLPDLGREIARDRGLRVMGAPAAPS